MPMKEVLRSAISDSPAARRGGSRGGTCRRSFHQRGVDRLRRDLAVLDRLDGQVAPAEAAIAAGPDPGKAGAAFFVDGDAATLERDRRAHRLDDEVLSDRAENH